MNFFSTPNFRFLFMFAVFGSLMGTAKCYGFQDEELFTTSPPIPRLAGQVVDSNGTGIDGASVTFVAVDDWRNFFPMIGGSPATQTAEADVDGRFEITFETTDPRFLRYGEPQIIVSAGGFGTLVKSVSMSRLIVDLPFEFRMNSVKDNRVRVLTHDGRPLEETLVAPGIIAGQRLPIQIAKREAVKTDRDGFVELAGTDRENLNSVYVFLSSDCGQLVPLEWTENQGIATLAETGTLRGTVELVGPPVNIQLDSMAIEGYSLQNLQHTPGGPRRFGWFLCRPNVEGEFEVPLVAFGNLVCRYRESLEIPVLPDSQSSQTPPEFNNRTPEFRWVLQFKAAKPMTLRFINELGEPIQGLDVARTSSHDYGFTDENGEIQMLFQIGQAPDGQLFPRDVYERYHLQAFGFSLYSSSLDENGEFKPLTMSRARALRGIVVDEEGNRVAGANIRYSFPSERFTISKEHVADRSGEFVLRGLPPNVPIEIRGESEGMASDESQTLEVVSGAKDYHVLLLRPQVIASPTGRVVDRDGNPIPHAKVSIYRASPLIKEGFGEEELRDDPFGFESLAILTDEEGMFRYPPTAEWRQRLRVKISANGYFPLETPFARIDLIVPESDQVYMGDFILVRKPEVRQTRWSCRNALTGQPVTGVKIVTVGALAGRKSVLVDQQGVAHFEMADASQVFAAQADGYHLALGYHEKAIDEFEIRLVPSGETLTTDRLIWFDRPRDAWRKMSLTLVDELQGSIGTESTVYRQSRFFKSLACADARRFWEMLRESEKSYQHSDWFIQSSFRELYRNSPELTLNYLREQPDSTDKAYMLKLVALMTEEDDLKDDLFGEAWVCTKSTSSGDNAYQIGSIAAYLLLGGRVEQAKSVMKTAWNENGSKYEEILETGKHKHERAFARIFAPVLAIIDPDTSLRLIELTADPDEIPHLTGQALMFLSIADWPRFEQVVSERQEVLNQDRLTRFEFHLRDVALPTDPLLPWLRNMASFLKDSRLKLSLQLWVASSLPPSSERFQWFEQASRTWLTLDVPGIFGHWSDPVKYALYELPRFKDLQPVEIDLLIFSCLEKMPHSFEEFDSLAFLANSARLLALRDTGLARQLLEPAFETSNWLFDQRGNAMFTRNPVLNSTVWIDPEWAGLLVRELSERYSPDDPVRQLQLYSGVIDEAAEILERRRR